jgi:hypothetical protein
VTTNFQHRLVGRMVVYRDPYRDKPEEGTITSVNEKAGLVFVRYNGSTSTATEADDRLTFLDGTLVSSTLNINGGMK